jgi:hypothetical protein
MKLRIVHYLFENNAVQKLDFDVQSKTGLIIPTDSNTDHLLDCDHLCSIEICRRFFCEVILTIHRDNRVESRDSLEQVMLQFSSLDGLLTYDLTSHAILSYDDSSDVIFRVDPHEMQTHSGTGVCEDAFLQSVDLPLNLCKMLKSIQHTLDYIDATKFGFDFLDGQQHIIQSSTHAFFVCLGLAGQEDSRFLSVHLNGDNMLFSDEGVFNAHMMCLVTSTDSTHKPIQNALLSRKLYQGRELFHRFRLFFVPAVMEPWCVSATLLERMQYQLWLQNGTKRINRQVRKRLDPRLAIVTWRANTGCIQRVVAMSVQLQ